LNESRTGKDLVLKVVIQLDMDTLKLELTPRICKIGSRTARYESNPTDR